MRKLATIRTISEVNSIPGADKIEVVTIDGWEVVAKKDHFKVGEKCIYIEVDSIVPPTKEFEFLQHRKYRIRTIKLRKQISQGIVFKLEELNINPKYAIGKDITEELGIVKYDPQAGKEREDNTSISKNPIHKFMLRYSWYRKLQPKKYGKWPVWIYKTDEERIQNMPYALVKYEDLLCYATEKVDGQSASYSFKTTKNIFKKSIFTVCSRNLWLKRPSESTYWRVAKKYNIKEKLKSYYDTHKVELLVQGEVLCEGVQKNKYEIPSGEIEFRVFNIFDITHNIWYGKNGVEELCLQLNLPMVPIVWFGALKELGGTVKNIVEYSKGKSTVNPKINREGIVIRQAMSSSTKRGLSFKAINPLFLLKYNK